MSTLNRIAGLGFCTLLAGLPHLSAQTSDIVEIYGGFNYTNATPAPPAVPAANLDGFVVGVGAFAFHWFGAAFELSKQYGTDSSSAGTYANANLHESSYLAGPQFRFLNTKRVNATAKTLLGGVQGQVFQPGSMASQTRFAVMLGASVDIGITRILAFRFEPGLYRTSFSGLNQNNFRFSFGPVLRFGHE
jgi:hypothetical protein